MDLNGHENIWLPFITSNSDWLWNIRRDRKISKQQRQQLPRCLALPMCPRFRKQLASRSWAACMVWYFVQPLFCWELSKFTLFTASATGPVVCLGNWQISLPARPGFSETAADLLYMLIFFLYKYLSCWLPNLFLPKTMEPDHIIIIL